MPENHKAALEQAIKAYPGKIGLAVRTLDGREFLLNANDSFQPASIAKLAVLCAAFQQLDMAERRALPKLARGGGWGVLQHLSNPLELPLRDIAMLMMFISDNAATDYLLASLPDKKCFPKMLRELGLKNTRIEKGFGTSYEPAEFSKGENSTTPLDILILLEHIRSKAEMKQMLAHQMDQAILHRALPGDVKRFTKSGQFDVARNDCGILEWAGGGGIISLFSAPTQPIGHGMLGYLADLDTQLSVIAKEAYLWAKTQ